MSQIERNTVREEYMELFNEKYDGRSVHKAYTATWKKIEAYESRTGKSLDDELTREDYIDLITSFNAKRNTMFVHCKVTVVAYVRYLVDRGILPEKQLTILERITFSDFNIYDTEKIPYYKNIQQLQDAVNETIRVSDRYDDSVYDCVQTAIYLTWFGASIEDIVAIEKSDVHENYVICGGKLYSPPKDIMNTIWRFRFADRFYQKARGVIPRYYKDSVFLMRTDRDFHIEPKNLMLIIIRFNQICGGKYSLTTQTIYDSGIFHRAYMKECECGRVDLSDKNAVCELFGEYISEPSRYKNTVYNYRKYREMFE